MITQFLVKSFIKDYKNTSNPVVRNKYGTLGGSVGILCNIFLSLSKLIVGLLSGSISILADSINNLSDAASSIITLIGFKISSKPADQDHPFGHARVEYVSGLVVAFIIMFLGLQLVKSSIEKIFTPSDLVLSTATVVILILSIIVKFWMSSFNKTLGKAIDSSALKATATDSFNDVIVTSSILISLIISHFTSIQLDGPIGILVACFILYSGVNIIKETINPLLGEAPTEELVNLIQEKILSYEGVLGLHDLMVHNYGPNRCFASVHVEVSSEEDILISHDLIDKIERDFDKELHIHLVIHLDPIVMHDDQVKELYHLTKEQVASIDPALTIHDFRMVQGISHTNLIFDVTVPPSYNESDQTLAHAIDERMKKNDTSYHTVITIDRSYIPNRINTTK